VIITIDGPAGSGKSTVAKILANKINFMFLDTGAMYRAVALAALKTNSNNFSVPFFESLLDEISIEFESTSVFLNGIDVTEPIRSKEVTEVSGIIAASITVRARLVELQRLAAKNKNMVCEGRDQGTTVFPNAFCKFFLTANPQTRANRRFIELQAKGINTTLQEILEAMLVRDKRDESREISPMVPANDAIILDTSELNMDQVINTMHQEIIRRMA